MRHVELKRCKGMGLEKLLRERSRRWSDSRWPSSEGMYPVSPFPARTTAVTLSPVQRTPFQRHGDASYSDQESRTLAESVTTAALSARRERPSEVSADDGEINNRVNRSRGNGIACIKKEELQRLCRFHRFIHLKLVFISNFITKI